MKLSRPHTHAFRMILVGELLDINKVRYKSMRPL